MSKKQKLQTLYYVTYMEDGMQGMFDKDANLLGYWYLNDAGWREEYFDGFMNKLGYRTESSQDKRFKAKLKEIWDRDQGTDSSEDDSDDYLEEDEE